MPKVNITPQTVLLTSGQAATFEATNENTDPVAVSWTLSSSIGTFAPPEAVNKPVPSATYVAPMIASAQTITLIAVNPEDHNNSASAAISLTSDAIAIVPAKVELMSQQSQQFIAVIAGCSTSAAGRALPGLLFRV
jgi:hypothetical protein